MLGEKEGGKRTEREAESNVKRRDNGSRNRKEDFKKKEAGFCLVTLSDKAPVPIAYRIGSRSNGRWRVKSHETGDYTWA